MGDSVGGLLRKLGQLLPRQPGGGPDGKEEQQDAVGLEDATAELLAKAEAYVRLEAEAPLSDLHCLERMNRLTAAKYDELAESVQGFETFQDELSKRVQDLAPVLDEIDAMHDAVLKLEKAAEQLETYSRRLEARAAAVMQE
jgi:biogenesis of lysosome-related organelles complex 1 subunit 2